MADALACPDCGSPMVLRPSRYGQFYGCSQFPACRGTHGAHPDGKPLGVPANTETKQARIAAHAAFDPLWQDAPSLYRIEDDYETACKRIRRRARLRAYTWLSEQMGIPFHDCHIGNFDKATCERVVQVCFGMTPFVLREWAKEREQPNHQGDQYGN